MVYFYSHSSVLHGSNALLKVLIFFHHLRQCLLVGCQFRHTDLDHVLDLVVMLINSDGRIARPRNFFFRPIYLHPLSFHGQLSPDPADRALHVGRPVHTKQRVMADRTNSILSHPGIHFLVWFSNRLCHSLSKLPAFCHQSRIQQRMPCPSLIICVHMTHALHAEGKAEQIQHGKPQRYPVMSLRTSYGNESGIAVFKISGIQLRFAFFPTFLIYFQKRCPVMGRPETVHKILKLPYDLSRINI